jgi:hypothetical protein
MLSIVPFTPEWTSAVREFNARLLAGGLDATLEFPETPAAEFSVDPAEPIWQEFFLAVEGSFVRGGYFLTHEPWICHGTPITVGNYRLPVSEGMIDAKYAGVALAIMRHALKRQPLIYCLGMGSYDRPLPRTLKAMKWPMFTTPFFFRSIRPGRVLRNLESMRRSARKRLMFDAAALTGAAWAGIRFLQFVKTKPISSHDLRTVAVDKFGSWADDLWARVSGRYTLLSRRDTRILSIRYPETDGRFLRLRFERDGSAIGWAVLLDTTMNRHKHFGDLRVGTIVDCFGDPAEAPSIVRSAASVLEHRGVDLIVSNQSHAEWCSAFLTSGFLEGPSNRIFAASPKLAEAVQSFDQSKGSMHLTRGDAAGPIHL